MMNINNVPIHNKELSLKRLNKQYFKLKIMK